MTSNCRIWEGSETVRPDLNRPGPVSFTEQSSRDVRCVTEQVIHGAPDINTTLFRDECERAMPRALWILLFMSSDQWGRVLPWAGGTQLFYLSWGGQMNQTIPLSNLPLLREVIWVVLSSCWKAFVSSKIKSESISIAHLKQLQSTKVLYRLKQIKMPEWSINISKYI